MKIVFMGTPDFAKESLQALYDAGHEILLVVTNPDRPKGRGMKLAFSPVKEYALEKNLKIEQPEKIRNNEQIINKIKELNPEVICVVAYGKILPKEILDIPKLGCINVHGSILPKYRGAAPIQWAVINGEKTTGITTMYMDEGMDTGDMLLKEEVEIGENETSGELWSRLSKIGAKLLVKTLKKIQEGTIQRTKQQGEFTLAPMLNKEMAKINWENSTACQIKNLVRGLNPIMGAFTFLNDKKLKIWKVECLKQDDFIKIFDEFEEYAFRLEKLEPGTVIYVNEKHGLYIKALDDIINIREIQAENSKKMEIGEFLRGNQIQVGEILS